MTKRKIVMYKKKNKKAGRASHREYIFSGIVPSEETLVFYDINWILKKRRRRCE